MSDDAAAPRNPDLRLPGHLLDRRVGADVEQVGHQAVGVGADLALHQEQGTPEEQKELLLVQIDIGSIDSNL